MTTERSSSHGWSTRKPHNAAHQARVAKYASTEHRAARKTIQAQLDTGQPVHCWRPTCRRRIPNIAKAWHVGHDDQDPRIIRGAEHARCNLRAAARKGAAIVNARRRQARVTRRDWYA